MTHIFPLEVLEQYADKLEGHWWRISKYQPLTEDFMRTFESKLNWEIVSQYQKLSENFISEFQGKVYWDKVCQYQKLSEKFIKQFKHKMAWGIVSQHQMLSEDFMIEFKAELNWEKLSQYQIMSMDFIDEMWEKIDKKVVAKHQKLNEKFVMEKDRIKALGESIVLGRIKLSEENLEKCLKRIVNYTIEYKNSCLFSIVENQKLSQDFCVRHSKILPLKRLYDNQVMTYDECEQILTTVGILNKLV